MKKIAILPLLLILSSPCFAQITGEVDYKELGIRFEVPSGWVGQESDGVFIMGSNSVAGIILVTTHAHTSLTALENDAKSGISEGSTTLKLDGSIEKINDNTLGALYAGTMEGQAVKSYSLGMINPHGSGVTIMALTTPEMFGDQHVQLAKQVSESVRFSEPATAPIIDQWKEKFTNARLTYLESYSSSGSSYGGYSTGGGYSQKEVIELCGQGYFNYNKRSSVSIDTGGAFGSSSSSGQGQGSWEVKLGADGGASLVLTFHDGEIYQYNLTYDQEGKTYLNGYRYFVTYGTSNNDGPNCY
jgi:hypothetical protein